MIYRLLADLVLLVHVLFVAFVLFGLILVLVGGARQWSWVRNPWFRLGHLLAILVVVGQAWLGRICPLTIWEMELRQRAGDATYRGSFIAHWLHELLFFDAPLWVFAVCYTVFGGLIVASWFLVAPRRLRRSHRGRAPSGSSAP